MELMGSGCINKWRELLGPTDSGRARTEAPMSVCETDLLANSARFYRKENTSFSPDGHDHQLLQN
jgi:hypothetical protein